MNCPSCKKKGELKLSSLYDSRFGIPGRWSIYVCKNCLEWFTVPRPSQKELTQYYENFYNFIGSKTPFYNKLRIKILNSKIYKFWLMIDGDISFFLQQGTGNLLDIGCNEGRTLELYKNNGYKVQGIELNSIAAASARKKGFEVFCGQINNFDKKEEFDVVVLSNVLEHELNPNEMLWKVNSALKMNGEIWLSFPNRNSFFRQIFKKKWINWHMPFHISHFSKQIICKKLENCGFKVFETLFESPSQWITLSILSVIFAKPEKTTKQLQNPVYLIFLMLITRFVFFPFLAILNLCEKGDCLIIKARKVVSLRK